MAPYIPFEIITEILAELPVKSLLKFRVVCKSWCSLISTGQFVRKHLSRKSSTPKRIILLSTEKLTFYSIQDSILVEEISPIEFPMKSIFSCRDITEAPSMTIMGYCDGLLCVKASLRKRYERQIFLWNPSTRHSKLLPSISGYNLCGGFGYDCNTDDYKVLIVLPREKDNVVSYKSMIYTLRTNTWRMIQDFPFKTSQHWWTQRSATLVHGALHWLAPVFGSSNRRWIIISFDLSTETYMEVAQPDCFYQVVRSAATGIGASNTGCLCFYVLNRATRNHDFWVMKEYGVRETWTKSICVKRQHPSLFIKPLTWFSESGEYIITRDGSRKLAIYNAKNNSVTSPFQLPEVCSRTRGDVYVESLISPNAYDNNGANEISRLNIHVGRMKRVEWNA